jgi:flagellar biosynthesis regulator FlaF
VLVQEALEQINQLQVKIWEQLQGDLASKENKLVKEVKISKWQ